MTIPEALKVILNTEWVITKGDEEQFLEALITFVDDACATAEWLYVTDTPFFDNVYKCSNCGKEMLGSRLTHWCGDCGCLMKVG